MEQEKMVTLYKVSVMTLTGFVDYLRLHGWPCTVDKAQRMIEAGVFLPAAYACPGTKKNRNGEVVKVTDYVIIPKRLDAWFEENHDDENVVRESSIKQYYEKKGRQ